MNLAYAYSVAVAIAVAAVTLYGIARALSRRPADADPSFGPPPEIRVLTRARLDRGRTLVVVEVEGRRLLLGSTKAQWCALADLGPSSARGDENPFASVDAELARALQATRYPKGWKHT